MVYLKIQRKKPIVAGVVICLIFVAGLLAAGYYYQKVVNQADKSWNLPKKQGETVKALDYSKFKLASAADIYQVKLQRQLKQQVKKIQQEKNYHFKNMLVLANPYLTSTTSLYIHFKLANVKKISYRVKTGKTIPTFSRTLLKSVNSEQSSYSYQLIGLIAGKKNQITITATKTNGRKITKTFSYQAPKLVGGEKNRLTLHQGSSKQHLSTGLYAFIGDQSQKQRTTYLVDNAGYIRGEIPLIGYNSLRLVQAKQGLYFAISSGKIVKVNRLGQVVRVYNANQQGFELHHDFAVDAKGNVIALATSLAAKKKTKYVEDRVIKFASKSGKVTELLNFRDLLPQLYQQATGLEKTDSNKGYHDVIHANAIQLLPNGAAVISSRETSTIIKINNLETKPELGYLIADNSVWQGVGNYQQLVLQKNGNFISQAGQHSVNYLPTDQNGVYYLEMFNNNSAIMDSRPQFNWQDYPGTGQVQKKAKNYSAYYKYLVNENTGTYQLVKSFKVPYSPYIGSVQSNGNNYVVDAGMDGQVLEYNQNGKLIQSLTTTGSKKFVYRVYKYNFNNFYFKK